MYLHSVSLLSFLLVAVVLADGGWENRPPHDRLRHRSTSSSDRWAGRVLDGQDLQTSFQEIGGTFIVPNVSGDVGSGVGFWVGIGGIGDVCESANVFQVGVDVIVTRGGPLYFGWYEWFPDPTQLIPFTVLAGDTVRVGVGLAPDLSFGTVLMEIGGIDVPFWRVVNISHPPCTRFAEWIVEDYQVEDTMVPLSEFTPVTFTNAVAFDAQDNTYGPQDAETYEMIGKNSEGSVLVRAYVSDVNLDMVTINRGSG